MFLCIQDPRIPVFTANHTAKNDKEIMRLLAWTRVTPDYLTRQSQSQGILKKDEEIFVFTDSRLINPPTENRQNASLINLRLQNQLLMVFRNFQSHPTTQQPKLI